MKVSPCSFQKCGFVTRTTDGKRAIYNVDNNNINTTTAFNATTATIRTAIEMLKQIVAYKHNTVPSATGRNEPNESRSEEDGERDVGGRTTRKCDGGGKWERQKGGRRAWFKPESSSPSG